MNIEVVFATPESQVLLSLDVSQNARVADALAESGLTTRFSGVEFDRLQAGVWGRPVARDYLLSEGDRVEFYRPLELDPKEARRQLALLGRTMSGGSAE